MERGKFIVFEGLDGSGKSTQVNKLKLRLDSLNIKCHFTREPSDSIPGGIIRSAITKKAVLEEETVALLFIADRIEHITNDILPFLNKGIHVISDRYYLSNIAYQGVSMKLETLINLNNMMIMNKLRPDVTFYLDTPPEECIKRLENERLHKELYEELEKLNKTQQNFYEAIDYFKDSEKIIKIATDKSVESTFERIWLKISDMFINEIGESI